MTPRSCDEVASNAAERLVRTRLLEWGFWLGDVMLGGAYLLGHAAAYVPPDTLWVLQLVALGVPYLGFAIATVAAAAALSQRWGLSAFHLVLWFLPIALTALAQGGGVGSVGAVNTTPSLTVVSFNANPTYMRVQGEQLARVLARERPHLFAFQEMLVRRDGTTGESLGGRVLGPLLRDPEYVPAWPVEKGDVVLALPVFSRIGLAGPAERLFGHPAKGLWESGGVDRALIQWQGQTVAVYNVHLHSFSRERPWKVRDGERRLFSASAWYDAVSSYRTDFRVRAEQARRLRMVLEAEDRPFIVCGDLNSTPANWVYAHLVDGLQDAFGQSGRGWGGTYHARLPLFRIDHIFASKEWEVRAAHVSKAMASDHRPIIADLALRPRGEERTN